MYIEVAEKFVSNKRRATKEELEKKHRVKIGESVKVLMKVASAGRDTITEKAIDCKVIGLYEKFVVLKTRFEYTRSMFWSDFEKALGKR